MRLNYLRQPKQHPHQYLNRQRVARSMPTTKASQRGLEIRALDRAADRQIDHNHLLQSQVEVNINK